MAIRGLRGLLFVCAAIFALLTMAPRAVAQPAVAQKHMVEGDAAGQAGRWADALAAYEKAHAASPSAATELRLANALYKLDRLVDAHQAYEKLLRDRSGSMLAGDKKTATTRLDELSAKTGTITIVTTETGAAVTVDGVSAGLSPLPKPVRVLAGSHKIAVSKEGFAPFETTVDVAGKSAVDVKAELAEKPKGGKVKVTVKGGEALQVVVDGRDVGPAPWEGILAPGPHTISGRSPALTAPAVTIEVKAGEDAAVELVPAAGAGTLDVRVETTGAEIYVDGEKVGDRTFKGPLGEGEHELRVTAEGYEPFVKTVTIAAGEVVAETVTLRKATAGEVKEAIEESWRFNGLYGGFQLVGMFEPAGSGNTLGDACAVTGATTCDGGSPMGGAIAGYIGWAFAPVGLELFLLGGGDVTNPTASFDGTTGSDINPLVARPAREEEFIIGRFGGGGAARLRLLFPVDRFRFTGAIGAGLAYREMLLGRDTVTAEGATSSIGTTLGEDSGGYLTGVLSIELAAQVLLGGTSSLVLGLNLWLEHAGDGVSTPARSDVFLTQEGEIPQPQATPSYDMASGTQLFIGPFLGMHFGP